jgi:predicted unusual protein kinase regulating ubiquinone biosynthesis (AarF/ABC1/UbiB family)/nucleotide-binding universal stress UspA family protein
MLEKDQTPAVHKILVGTDRSESADKAVRWAARMAAGYQAELLIIQVIMPPTPEASANGQLETKRAGAMEQLKRFAEELAGPKADARVVVEGDPAGAILRVAEQEKVDVVVVGNVGMAGRKQFLLGNVPNRISHNARCTVIIVNTAGLTPSVQATARTGNVSGDGARGPGWEGQLLRRGLRIARVLAKAGLRDALKKSIPGDESTLRERARRFRSALDQLGPVFAKLGQVLSTRPDLLPPIFVEELSKLQEGVTPLTEAEVVAVMEQELQVPWEDVFASIDPKPLAAGTIAQVHRATLETGERVVVKVQRPNAEQDILLDLGLLEMFTKKASSRPAFSQVVDLPAIIQNLSESLRRELDFRQEARNIERMRDVLASFSRLAVPKVYQEYSTARLLTMEEVQGVPVRQAPEGRARTEAARQLLESFYHQVFTEGFFHADPHPGNMKWWNDKIYFLDLGMVGELEPEVRELLLMLLLAFSQGDVPFLSEVVLRLAGGQGDEQGIDFTVFREDLDQFVQRYRARSLKDVQLGPMIQEMTQLAIRHHVRLPVSLALVGKAFAQMQLAATGLDPTLDPFSIAGSYALKSTVRQFTGILDPQKLFYEVQKARGRFMRLLESIEGATGARPGNKLQVHFRGTEQLERTIAQGSRWLAFGLVVSGALIATAVTAVSTKLPWGVPAGIAASGFVVALALLAESARRSR